MRIGYRSLTAIVTASFAAALTVPTMAGASVGVATPSGVAATDADAGAGSWESAETIASGDVSHALAVGPGGRATLTWAEDGIVYAKRKTVAGDWSQRQEIGPGHGVRAHTLGNGVTVIGAIGGTDVTMYRWRDDGTINKGSRFGYEYVSGDIELVGNNQGDLMLQWQVEPGDDYPIVCRYHPSGAAQWKPCNSAPGGGAFADTMDEQGAAYAAYGRLYVYRPATGWVSRDLGDNSIDYVSANGRGDLAGLDLAASGDQVAIHAGYRPKGEPFGPWTRITEYGTPAGVVKGVYAHRGGTASLVWDQKQRGDGDDPTVQVTWRRPNGSWTGARQIMDGGAVTGFDSNPLSDAVVTATSDGGQKLWAITRTRDNRYADPVLLSESGSPNQTSTEVAMDRHGNAVVAYLEEDDAGEVDLVTRSYKAS